MALYEEELRQQKSLTPMPPIPASQFTHTTTRPTTAAPTPTQTNNIAELQKQLKDIRKEKESQWKLRQKYRPHTSPRQPRGGGGGNSTGGGGGKGGMFNGGLWNQLQQIRRQHRNKWHNTNTTRKRVWTLSDLQDRAAYVKETQQGSWLTTPEGASLPEMIGRECLKLTNDFRAKQKLPALTWNPALYKIATKHSEGDLHYPPLLPLAPFLLSALMLLLKIWETRGLNLDTMGSMEG